MITRFIANAAALALATWLLSGITLGAATTTQQALTIAVVAAIFGLLNALVKPLVKLLTLPLVVLSLGLFLWVINAGMLMLTSALASHFGWAWHVDGWGTALIGALIVTVVGGLVGHILDGSDE